MDINNINGMVVSIATIHRNMEDTCFALGKSNLKLDQDMSCEKLFGYNSGREWGVSHYRFVKR